MEIMNTQRQKGKLSDRQRYCTSVIMLVYNVWMTVRFYTFIKCVRVCERKRKREKAGWRE